MENVMSFFEKRREIRDKFACADLRRLGFGAVRHRLIKLVEGNGFAEIVGILFSVQGIMKADIPNISLLKMLCREVCGGTAAEYVFSHAFTFFL